MINRTLKWLARRLGILLALLVMGLGIVFLWIVSAGNADPTFIVGIAAVSAFFSLVSAVAGLIQAVEIQRQRENAENPHVLVYFEGKSNHMIYAIIENFGHTPAKEICIKFDPSPLYMREKQLNDVGPFANSIPLLPSGKKFEQIIDSGPELLMEGRTIRFRVSLRYSSLNGHTFDEEDIIDLSYMKEATLPSPSASEAVMRVAKELESISKRFDRVTSFDSIMVETPELRNKRMQDTIKDSRDENQSAE